MNISIGNDHAGTDYKFEYGKADLLRKGKEAAQYSVAMCRGYAREYSRAEQPPPQLPPRAWLKATRDS